MANHDPVFVAKDTFFYEKQTLNCRGQLLFLDEGLLMGILNVTPDSFFDGGKYTNETTVLKRAEQMLTEGAGIIDVGGYSSRPNADDIPEKEEIKRLIPAIKSIKREFPEAVISADTFRSRVAREAVECGASIINDISGGDMDPAMAETAASLQVPYVLMHMKGNPRTMQQNPSYSDVVLELIRYFSEKIHRLRELGLNDIILDPGFGFAKNLEHNYRILDQLHAFRIFGLPVLAGLSRKSMISKVLGKEPGNTLNGTTVLNTMALMNGAKILRVHDVAEAKEALLLYRKLKNGKS